MPEKCVIVFSVFHSCIPVIATNAGIAGRFFPALLSDLMNPHWFLLSYTEVKGSEDPFLSHVKKIIP